MVHDYPPLTGGGLAIGVMELACSLRADFRIRVLSSRLADHFADDRAADRRVGPERGPPEWALVPSRHGVRWLREADAVIVHWTFSFVRCRRRRSWSALCWGSRRSA